MATSNPSQLQLVCGQRRSALMRARGLQTQLAEKAKQIQDVSEREEVEADQRVKLLMSGRQRAQERSKALKSGLVEVTQEVESLRWRVSALQRLLDHQEAESQQASSGSASGSDEVLQLRQKRLAVEEKCRSCNESNEALSKKLEEKSKDGDSVKMVKEALKAFAEGACATFSEAFQRPLLRRLALLEDSLQRIHQPLQGLRSFDRPAARQELLNSGHDLLKAFSTLVEKNAWDGRSSRLQAPLAELREATRQWRQQHGHPVPA
eukprot:symbB.v1.2.016013.t1/scaffold1206.1/size131539/3